MEERRASPFTEKLSLFMVSVAALGAFLVLFDPKFSLTFWGQEVAIGGDGFSADLKGAVISAILIGGWTAVKEYWLGASVGTVKSAEVIQRIAESGPTSSAAAVAAATGAPASGLIKAEDVNVQAAGDVTVATVPAAGSNIPDAADKPQPKGTP